MEENEVATDMTKKYMNWVQNDSTILSILAATLSNDALSFIIGSKSSKEIWCRRKEKYVDDSRYNIMNLKNSLYKIKKDSDSIDRYLFRVKSICDQLATMGVYMDDEDIVVSVLNGLPSRFATIKTVIRIKALSSSVSMKDSRSLLLIGEDEIEQTLKSISLSLETAMAAISDTSRGNVQSHSLNSTCLHSSEMEYAAVISNSNALTNSSSKLVTQFVNSTPVRISLESQCPDVVNAMMQNGNFGVPLMSNNGHMVTSTPNLSAGSIVGNVGSIAYPLGSSVVPTSEALCNGTIPQPNTSHILQNGEPLQ
uniref:uncharacterized protein LOC105353520 n=1 Tax=Fragaria vesca subsp. vesca TaxID=101020 RepID=UPI0005C8DE69|nr:PREDICTED: uncharacterized protein LOC105353520 [Fragaria vesca subsp. vesca]